MEYDAKTIKSLVEELKSQGWVFAYMGANQDVDAVGASLSITNTLSFTASEEGMEKMCLRERKARMRIFESMTYADYCAEEANMSFFKEDDEE